MALQLEDLVALDAPMPNATGTPLLIALDHIDEDPEQPRREFDEEALQALADTVRERGVRQPISVRPGLQPNRWVLNFGARRLRAARLAGLSQIPAFVDTTADRYDQVIENEQREGLKPLELAMFVSKRLALGESQSEIARKLGKSRQWVALVTAMIDPPDWLLQAYRDGRCRGLRELHELRRLHEAHPAQVEAWQQDQSDITRSVVEDLRARLMRDPEVQVDEGTIEPMAEAPSTPEDSTPREVVSTTPVQTEIAFDAQPRAVDRRPKLMVELDALRHELVVDMPPVEPGHVYVRPIGGGTAVLISVDRVRLLGFMLD
jgi:ParB family chromosome partitioning protein